MKYNAALFTTLAVSIASIRAAPAQEHPQAAFTPSDPFVACVQKTSPEFRKFPTEGKSPTTAQLRACFPGAHLKTARELVSRNVEDNFDSALQSRGLGDIPVLKSFMGLDQKAKCQDKDGAPTKLHDEFVWVEDVTKVAGELCRNAIGTIDKSGLQEDGGVAYAYKQFTNGHDDQNNFLHNGRKLLLTMAIDFFPPTAMAKGQVKDLAKGVHKLCSASLSRLMDPRDGCTSEVNWYGSKKAKWRKQIAAVGGDLGIYYDGSNNHVGTIRLGFSEDSN
jgi:hypothetical protein